MKLYFYAIVALFATVLTINNTYAQGCVAVRQMGGVNPLSSNGYTLPKGEFQIGGSYRYFHSWRHFVGKEEQEHRQHTQGGFDYNGKEKGNAVNIYSHSIDLNLSYALTDRIQLNVAIPYVHNERSQVLATKKGGKIELEGRMVDQTLEGIRYSVFAKGLGDIRINSTYWIFDPAKAMKGNILVGAGIKLNTGSHTEKDRGLFLNPNSVHGNMVFDSLVMMDQAIQPGDGGIGFSLELQGFRQIYKSIYGFANGYYLFNPKESNGSFKSAPKAGLEGYNIYACPDQYFARVGLMVSVLKSKNLTFSAAGRWEGIPAYDAFGGQVAYRRPGYVIAVESGISYRAGQHSLSLFIPFNVVRDRIQSAADIADQNLRNSQITDASQRVHVQGDAAFADYSVNINYAYRLGKLFKPKTETANPFN